MPRCDVYHEPLRTDVAQVRCACDTAWGSTAKSASVDNMTMTEVIELLNRPPELARTIEYITRRACHAYPPFERNGAPLPRHMLEHTRECFNCGNRLPEHAGSCYHNFSCEIWVCEDCKDKVASALQPPVTGPAR